MKDTLPRVLVIGGLSLAVIGLVMLYKAQLRARDEAAEREQEGAP